MVMAVASLAACHGARSCRSWELWLICWRISLLEGLLAAWLFLLVGCTGAMASRSLHTGQQPRAYIHRAGGAPHANAASIDETEELKVV